MKNKFVYLYLAILCSLFFQTVKAQNCPEGFKIKNSQGQEDTVFCIGEMLRFENCLGTVDPSLETYNPDSINNPALTNYSTANKTHAYTKAGRYKVSQWINNVGNSRFKSRWVVIKDNPAPKFIITACANNKVTIRITDSNYDNFNVNYGDGSPVKTLNRGDSEIKTFPSGGSKTIKVTASYQSLSAEKCPVTKDTTVSLLQAPATPLLQTLTVLNQAANGEIKLDLQNINAGFNYIVQAAAPNQAFIAIDTLRFTAGGTVSASVKNTDTRTPLTYRVYPLDACNSVANIRSNNIFSQQIISAQALNRKNNITWNAYQNRSDVKYYLILRNDVVVDTVSGTSYEDTTVSCGTNYCYRIKTVLTNNTQSVSAEKCVTTISTVDPKPGYLFSTFNDQNQVELTFTLPAKETLETITIKRSLNGRNFSNLETINQQNFTDLSLSDLNQQPCYRVTYKDNCQKTSPESNTSCPVFLQTSISNDEFGSLKWSAYKGFKDGVKTYIVQLLDNFGNVTDTIDVGTDLTYLDRKVDQTKQILIYRIKAVSKTSNEITFSNRSELVQEFKVFFPNAFSPNGDGLNDIFAMKGKFLSNTVLKIYDRWGQVVFQSNNSASGWDGMINGDPATVGAYVYYFVGYDEKNKKYERTGTINLVR